MKNNYKIIFYSFIIILASITLINAGTWNNAFDNNLVAYYTFDSNSNSDYKGTINLSEQGGIPKATNCKSNGCYFFNGAGYYLINNTQAGTMPRNSATSSYSFWVKVNNSDATAKMIFMHGTGSNPNNRRMYFFNDYIYVGYSGGVTTNKQNTAMFDNQWHNIVLIWYNTGGIEIYYDGAIIHSASITVPTTTDDKFYIGDDGTGNFFKGYIDEFAVWNRSISAEVASLYDAGIGTFYSRPVTLTINSPSPTNNSIKLAGNITFNITVNQNRGQQLSNVTLYLNNILNETINIVGTSNTTSFIKSLSTGAYNYSFLACDVTNNCTTSETTFFNISSLVINSYTYTNSTFEGNAENFILNFTPISESSFVSASFIYNNMTYPTTISVSGSNYIASSSINIPAAPAGGNYTFYWSLNFLSGITNTSNFTQYVKAILLIPCNAIYTTTTLNFSLKEEATFIPLNGSLETTLNYWSSSGGGSINKTMSFANMSNNRSSFAFCLSPAYANLSISGIISYSAVGYDTRTYFFNNANINNQTQDISLYLALTTATDLFTFVVIDENENPISNAYVYLQQWDIGTGNFYTSAIGLTGASGQTSINMRLNDRWYRQIVIYNNIMYLVTTPSIETADTTPKTLRIIITQLNPYLTFNNIPYSFTYNNISSTFSFIYADTTGKVQTACLKISKLTSMNGSAQISLECIQTASGTLTYTLTQNGTFIGNAIFILTPSYESISQSVKQLIISRGVSEKTEVFKTYGFFAALLLIGTLAMIGVASENIPFGCILIVIGAVASSLIGLINLSATVLYSLAGIAILIGGLTARRYYG